MDVDSESATPAPAGGNPRDDALDHAAPAVERVILKADPFVTLEAWPAHWAWIADEPTADTPAPPATGTANTTGVVEFRLDFSLDVAGTHLLHVAADQRYELWLNGVRIARGAEPGDLAHWPFDTVRAALAAGAHRLVARVSWLGEDAPLALHTLRGGFVCAASTLAPHVLNTGIAPWRARREPRYQNRPHNDAWGCGARAKIVGAALPADLGWREAAVSERAVSRTDHSPAAPDARHLVPARLPAQIAVPWRRARVRHVAIVPPGIAPDGPSTSAIAIATRDHRPADAIAWDAVLAGDGAPVVVPANTALRVVIDLDDYACVYPRVVTSGGAGATLRLFWVESLIERLPQGSEWAHAMPKGNRDEVEGKFVWSHPRGVGDEFLADGTAGCAFEPMRWSCGRFAELTIATAGEPISIDAVGFVETGYPVRFADELATSDAGHAATFAICRRALRMCSLETFVDCPYFEQLQYIGDARLQALCTMATTRDDRLVRQALTAFDRSRDASGLTQSRAPCRKHQSIPPFSLWWVCMAEDHVWWRGDAAFTRTLLPGLRAVLDAFAAHVDPSGLLAAPPGWNYVDWTPHLNGGAGKDIDGVLIWQYVLALRAAATIERFAGSADRATDCDRRAAECARRASDAYFVGERSLFANDRARSRFSEHAQCLALLSGALDPQTASRVLAALLDRDASSERDSPLDRATIYFSHYLFDACARAGRADVILDRMDLWRELTERGLRTTVESPEPTRSDCHAWGAHPLYHLHASVLGVRPASPGFASVTIRPQLGRLQWARGSIPHPGGGDVRVEFHRNGEHLRGKIELPPRVHGAFCDGVRVVTLAPGLHEV